jgi:tetratricopeptide (TPR) repeat protein
VSLALLQAHVALMENDDISAAITTLKKLDEHTSEPIPAITAALVSLQSELKQTSNFNNAAVDADVEELLSKLAVIDDDAGITYSPRQIRQVVARAQYLQEMGRSKDAIHLCEHALEAIDDDDDADEVRGIVIACLVQALAERNPERARELAQELPDLVVDPTSTMMDPEELENRPLPRLHRTRKSPAGASGAGAGMAAVDGNSQTLVTLSAEKKKIKEHRLRQRAKKRELHIETLKTRGDYNMARPPIPDPERWIPKHQRSSNKNRRGRGRGQRGNDMAGAQGAGAGTDKDAARLDVAARKGEGAPPPSSTSTAHMTVSGSGNTVKRKGRKKK